MHSTEIYAVSRDAGAEALEVRTNEVVPPPPGEARVMVEAAGVSYGDLLFQRGVVPGGPKPPYIPGCDLTGVVEAVGERVTGVRAGQRVTALVRSGGYATVVNVPAERLVEVPPGLDAVDVAAVSLNFFIAYQMLHRIAHVQPGHRILVHGASGGVGLAFLQLAQHIGDVRVWGTCSAQHADLVRAHGATPIDYRSEDFTAVVRTAGGQLHAAFDPIGGTHFLKSYQLLARGGWMVAYGQNAVLRNGNRNMAVGGIGFLTGIVVPKLIPDGRHATFYSAWALEERVPSAYREDLTTVVDMLAGRRVSPPAVTVLPVTHASAAFKTLERGADGKLVLVGPSRDARP